MALNTRPQQADKIDTTENGEGLLKWCLKNNIKITNSIFRTKRINTS